MLPESLSLFTGCFPLAAFFPHSPIYGTFFLLLFSGSYQVRPHFPTRSKIFSVLPFPLFTLKRRYFASDWSHTGTTRARIPLIHLLQKSCSDIPVKEEASILVTPLSYFLIYKIFPGILMSALFLHPLQLCHKLQHYS